MSSASIFVGPWINHSHSVLVGATITLKTREAGFLLALLVVVVGAAGRSFWTITSYTIHQLRSKEDPQDALHYQQQAILKNSGTALGTAWKLGQVSFSWRKHERSRWWQTWKSRSFWYILIALLVAAIFGVASIFSSQVNKSVGPEFLIHSPDCGFWDFALSQETQWLLKTLNESITAAAYTRSCYGSNETTAPQCVTYKTSQIPWTSNENASCPFAAGTCRLGSTAAYQMDTGPLDSHEIFGLNAKASERVTLRKVATCAPIITKPYAELVNQSVDGGLEMDTYIFYNMGPVLDSASYTYSYNTHTINTNVGYELVAQNSLAGAGSDWEPIPDFNRTDADVSMFFLAPNSVIYNYPNTDPMFSATIEANLTYLSISGNGNITQVVYEADYYVNVIGCTDQYQICNPNEPGPDGQSARCTPLGPFEALPTETLNIGLNDYQYATSGTITISMRSANMYYAVAGRGSSALRTEETVFNAFNPNQVAQIPNNRWQSELSGWFAISLASLQQALVEKASGPTDVVNVGGTIDSPDAANKPGQAVCKRQMIRNVSGYENFSTLGVATILIVGTILIILGWNIDILVGRIQRRHKRNFARLSWISDGYLQMQRMAYEGAGYSDWMYCADEVPVSNDLDRASQRLGPLNIDNLDHPQLERSVTAPTASSTPAKDLTPEERAEDEGPHQDGYPMLSWHGQQNA